MGDAAANFMIVLWCIFISDCSLAAASSVPVCFGPRKGREDQRNDGNAWYALLPSAPPSAPPSHPRPLFLTHLLSLSNVFTFTLGLPKWTYYLSHYIFCFILFMVVIVFFYLVGAVTEIRLFRQTNFIVLFLFLFAWGNALICMSMLFSTFISSKRASVIVGCIFIPILVHPFLFVYLYNFCL